MDSIICSNRSREILKEYKENQELAIALVNNHNNIDFSHMFDVLEQMRQNWYYEKVRVKTLEEELHEKNNEKESFRFYIEFVIYILQNTLWKENHIYKEQLRDARSQITTLISENMSMKQDIIEWERKFELVNELLKDQSNLSDENRHKLLQSSKTWESKSFRKKKKRTTSMNTSCRSSNEEEIDFDKSDNSLDESRLRNGKVYRRLVISVSSSMISLTANRCSVVAGKKHKQSMLISTVDEEMTTSPKRSKSGSEVAVSTAVAADHEGKKSPVADAITKRPMDRSYSTAQLDQLADVTTLTAETLTPRTASSTTDVHTPVTKTWTHGGLIKNRPHTYISHSSILGDHCGVCNGWIGIVGKQAYKCYDCGLHVHKSCTEKAPMPCIPRISTPRTPSKQRPRLKDLCPVLQPMIPPILIHCILALEKDRMSTEGIYRIPGDDSEVQKLLNEFQNGRIIPKLDYHDTETITSCIKQFLSKLRDPIIPTTSWEEFVNAAEIDSEEALIQGIMDLPYANRDTLAFLCAHFQKICDNCMRNKMTPNTLSRCIAATIVGSAPPSVTKVDEEAKQIRVMLALLKMPRDFWPGFYTFKKGVPLINTPKKLLCDDSKTPVRTPYKDPNKSILGPVQTPPSGQASPYHPKISRRRHLLGDIF
ncbi:unnamed protein product [Thelazia callipaeda]|uniref:Phorbol-ester/DAG-type domain-containing protein n=1 Tax=Thelazia callipaeda TaxID=103827 RepID=A0A0N5D499_THECL|nr:unnamed protein product [Thelazia callipaeda]